MFTTLHQSYAYEDFVEGIRPDVEEDAIGEQNNQVDVGGTQRVITYSIKEGLLKRSAINANAAIDSNNNNPYALFIDEINRGNVAEIFGELISLIEEDKREGRANEMSVTLPYSQDEFTLPGNLYFIGTMNTADRSVEALDAALRRRFHFIEMMPQPELLNTRATDNNINLQNVLRTINKRLTVLLDRDHTIGHAYLMGVDTAEELRDAFYNKIIPQLKEYFYNDLGKIGLVLGEYFVYASERQKELFNSSFDYSNNNTSKLQKAYSDEIDELKDTPRWDVKVFGAEENGINMETFLGAVQALSRGNQADNQADNQANGQ